MENQDETNYNNIIEKVPQVQLQYLIQLRDNRYNGQEQLEQYEKETWAVKEKYHISEDEYSHYWRHLKAIRSMKENKDLIKKVEENVPKEKLEKLVARRILLAKQQKLCIDQYIANFEPNKYNIFDHILQFNREIHLLVEKSRILAEKYNVSVKEIVTYWNIKKND